MKKKKKKNLGHRTQTIHFYCLIEGSYGSLLSRKVIEPDLSFRKIMLVAVNRMDYRGESRGRKTTSWGDIAIF